MGDLFGGRSLCVFDYIAAMINDGIPDPTRMAYIAKRSNVV